MSTVVFLLKVGTCLFGLSLVMVGGLLACLAGGVMAIVGGVLALEHYPCN